MNRIYLTALLLAIAAAGCSKKDTKTSQTCSTTEFDCLYHSLTSDYNYWDADTTGAWEVHSYSFTVSAPHSIVQLGYRSLPNFDSTPYVMEIYDSTAGMLLYSGAHIFLPTATSYVTIGPVAVVPGHLYSVRWMQTNWGSSIAHTIGRVAVFAPKAYTTLASFPKTEGDLTVIGAVFYNVDSAAGNLGQSIGWLTGDRDMPYIDLVLN